MIEFHTESRERGHDLTEKMRLRSEDLLLFIALNVARLDLAPLHRGRASLARVGARERVRPRETHDAHCDAEWSENGKATHCDTLRSSPVSKVSESEKSAK